MVNIKDCWPQQVDADPNDPQVWEGLLQRRRFTGDSFLKREVEKGIIHYITRFDQPPGQDTLRLTMFRIIEEYGEAVEASDEEHVLEELMDAFFFLLEIPMLDRYVSIPIIEMKEMLYELAQRDTVFQGIRTSTVLGQELGAIAYGFALFTDHLRNRSWMNHAQDVYFAGAKDLKELIRTTAHVIFSSFDDWDQFWHYFIAKDEVLKFRLKSNY